MSYDLLSYSSLNSVLNITTMNGAGTGILNSNTTMFKTGNVYKYSNNTIHIHFIIIEINIVKYYLFFIDLLMDNFVSFNRSDAQYLI